MVESVRCVQRRQCAGCIKWIAAFYTLLVLSACVPRTVPVPAPIDPAPLTFEDRIYLKDGVRCADLTAHDSSDTPDCEAVYDAADRGRSDYAAKVDPAALDVKLSTFQFLQPRLEVSPSGKPYPVIAGADMRGLTSNYGWILITFSYAAVVRHEIAHALDMFLHATERRTDEVVAVNCCQIYRFEILCHGTIDDPLGVPGNVSSCIDRQNERY